MALVEALVLSHLAYCCGNFLGFSSQPGSFLVNLFSKCFKRFLLSTTGCIPLFCYKSHCLPDLSTLIFTTLALYIFSLLNIWTSPNVPCFLLPSIFAHMPPVFFENISFFFFSFWLHWIFIAACRLSSWGVWACFLMACGMLPP